MRILLCEFLVDILRQLSADVCAKASDLATAIELAETQLFDVAVVDLSLQGEFAYPLLDILRSRAIPFILSTCYSRTDIDKRYRGEVTVCKPYSLAALRAAVEKVHPGFPLERHSPV